MKKTKFLTVLGVLLAMGITACNNTPKSSEPKSEEPASSQPAPESKPQPSSKTPSEPPAPKADATGHIWGADADVAGDAEKGLAAYKRAVCTDHADKAAVKLTVNQSAVKYDKGSRKSGTPDGYTKLNANGDIMSFKFNTDKILKGKMYLFGCMDGYSSNMTKNFCYYQNKPNLEVQVNETVVDVSAQAEVKFQDIFGTDTVGDNLSNENYALLGDVVLQKGVNEIIYKRVATLNILIKDFVFVGEELDKEWSDPETVAADTTAGTVGYKKYTSLVNGDIKLEINALDGTFAEGSSNKSGTEEGYLKLNSNGNKISWKFNFDSAAKGTLEHYGFMDSFSSNHDVKYSWTSTSGNHAPTLEGNLRASINNNRIDRSEFIDVRAEDLTKDGDATAFAEEKNYSPLTLLPVGDIVLKNGVNELTYERLGSYNYVVNTLVLVVSKASAEFVVEETLSHDDNGHFNKVTGTDIVFNRAAHEWAANEAKPDEPATSCATKGKHYEKCSCGAERIVEIPSTIEHTWVEKDAVQNADGKNIIPMECSACKKLAAKMSENDYSSAEFDSGKGDDTPDALRPSQNKAIVYKIVVSKAGNYSLNFGMFCKSNDTVKLSERRFSVKVNDENATVTLDGTKTPKDLGMTATNAVQVELCASIALKEGENTISITCASYRLHYKGNLVVIEL